MTLIRFLAAALLASAALPASAAEKVDILGKWQCEYGVRTPGKPDRDSAAWFEVTLKDGSKFHGGGKAMAGGSTLNMTLRGTWVLKEDVLKLTGISEVANQQLPFRFVSDVVDATTIERVDSNGEVEYRTGCQR